jgi:PAS domain S-box-containing protein
MTESPKKKNYVLDVQDFEALDSKTKAQILIENIPQSVFWKNTNSEYIWTNQRFASDGGVDSPEDLVGKTDFDMPWTKEQSAAFVKDDRAVIASGKPKLNIIEPQRRSDGQYAWLNTNKVPIFDPDGNVIGLIGTYEDITERTQTEIALRRYEHMMDTVFNNIPVAIFWKDSESRFLGCNANFATDAGLDSPSEIVGKTDFDFPWADEHAQEFIDDDHYVMETGEARLNYIEQQRQKDGKLAWLQTNKVPLRDGEGNIIGVLGTYQDITNQIDASEELRRARSAAQEERQRLARDLHDAVSQTLWTASLIADVLPTTWEQDREKGQRNLEQLRRLTQGALAEMRMLLLELRPTSLAEANLNTLLQRLAEATMSRKKLHVVVTAENEISLPADVKIALYRIAQGIFNNVTRHARATKATIDLKSDKNQLTLTITDNGKGFDMSQVEPDRMGIGIMNERAAAINAKLTLDSTVGEGTTVLVEWTKSEETL